MLDGASCCGACRKRTPTPRVFAPLAVHHCQWAARAQEIQRKCSRQQPPRALTADELYTKPHAGLVWIATAMTVFARLWWWSAINWERDTALLEPVVEQVRAAAQAGRPLLFAVDGFKAYLSCIVTVFRDRQPPGTRGHARDGGRSD
jgi:hypothetical protein